MLAGGGRPRRARATATSCEATVIGDVDESDDGLPGGDLRPGARRDAVRRRGGGGPAGQRDAVRAGRLRVDERHSARAPGRPGDRHRHVLDQLPERARSAHAVRRRQGSRGSAARAATTRSSSTATPRSSTSRWARHHDPAVRSAEDERRSDERRDRPRARRRRATPPFDILRSAYAELQVTDLAASEHFYVDLLGLVVSRAHRRRALPARLGGAPAPLARAAPGADRRPRRGSPSASAARRTSTRSLPSSSGRGCVVALGRATLTPGWDARCASGTRSASRSSSSAR